MTAEGYQWHTRLYRQSQQLDAASPSTDELWRACEASRPDPAARHELILRYAPLVRYVSGRLAVFLPPSLSIEDLLSYGTVGLIEAVDRFDHRQGVKFETYATRRIWGSMIDALRKLSILPRGTSRQVRALEDALSYLEGELGRAPTTVEVAQRLGVEESTVYELLVAANFSVFSLETAISGDEDGNLTLLDTLAAEVEEPSAQVERQELLARLAKAIDRLPERERLVLALYYYEELTLKEIGKVLRVSESRVSQLHSVALARLERLWLPAVPWRRV